MLRQAREEKVNLWRNRAWNAILCVLLVLLFVQCGLYVWRYASSRITTEDIPFNMKMLSATSADSAVSIDDALLLPETIAVSHAGECRAAFFSSAVIEEMYGEISDCLSVAFLGKATQVTDAEWQNVAQGDFVYAQFTKEIPYQVVHAFAGARAGEEEQLKRADYIGVREILLASGRTEQIALLYVHGEGGVYRFSLSSEKRIADFAGQAIAFGDVFSRATLVNRGGYFSVETESSLPARTIYASSAVTSLLTVNQDVLRLLNFNPDKLNYHVEPDGTVVYVESHGLLRVNADELLYQASDPGGIDAFELNGGDDGDIYAYLRVASYLINRFGELNVQYTGGDARLQLTSVTGDGRSIALHFAFYCDNIAIIDELGTEYGMTLTFTEGKLTELSYRMLIVRRSLEERNVMLQSWYRRMLAGSEDAHMRLVYVLFDGGDSISAVWSVQDREGGEAKWAG